MAGSNGHRKTSLEQQANKLHLLAVKAFRAGENQRWLASLFASLIVGRFEVGKTLDLASELRLSSAHIRRLAGAYVTYQAVRKLWPRYREYAPDEVPPLYEIRNGLTVSHFAALGELWRRYEFDPDAMVQYLVGCYRDRISVEALRVGVEQEEGSDRSDWTKDARRLLSLVERLAQNSYELPEGVQVEFEEILENLSAVLDRCGIRTERVS